MSSQENRSLLQRYTGKKEYEFGDITRTTLTKVDQAFHWLSAKTSEFFGDLEASKTSAKTDEKRTNSRRPKVGDEKCSGRRDAGRKSPIAASQLDDGPVDVELIWDSLLNRAYYFGQHYKSLGLLKVEDFADCDAFLYVGLPALTLFEAALRSVGHRGLVLAAGLELDEKAYPAEHAQIYQSVTLMRDELQVLMLTDFELHITRQILLFSSDPEKIVEGKDRISDSRMVCINRLVAKANSVASRLTQMPFFKENFNGIINRLANFPPE